HRPGRAGPGVPAPCRAARRRAGRPGWAAGRPRSGPWSRSGRLPGAGPVRVAGPGGRADRGLAGRPGRRAGQRRAADRAAAGAGRDRSRARPRRRADLRRQPGQRLGRGVPGAALPAAIGVASAGRRTVVLTGDGALGYAAGELATLTELGLPVTVVVLNNRSLGWIRWYRRIHFGRGWEDDDFADVAFSDIARGF